MRRTTLLVCIACAALAPAGAQARGFLAGAAVLDTTPPQASTPAGRHADAAFGAPGCPSAVYPASWRFALGEPFTDLNGNLSWDAGAAPGAGEPFCDANGNGRWDGIYADNGNGPATGVHDPIEVRAFAVSDGRDLPVVYASVDQIGLFDFYTEAVRARLAGTYHVRASLVVSADHNESSPDSIGLYGPYQTPLGVGLQSGIDEYYMRYLEDRVARAAALAVGRLRPATLYATQVERPLPDGASGDQYPLLRGLSQRISTQFPTTVALPRDNRLASVDPKLGVLQARGRGGRPIFTVMSLAAHNQEMGNAGAGLSADWPGAFARAFDARHFGTAVFLVAANGSQEDPQTTPTVVPKGSENHTNQATQWRQAAATGSRFAALVAAAAPAAQQLRSGAVRLVRRAMCVPLENNGFLALAATGEFGRRQGYTCDAAGNPVAPVAFGGPAGSFRTFVAYADLGPDLQLIDVPGEAFPALMLGSPFGVEEASCAGENPPPPVWHARASYRFSVGLADDLLGYLLPPWSFASGTPGLFTSSVCANDAHGHRHKLESESVGPTGAADVATELTRLLGAEPDRTTQVTGGRFVRHDGSVSRWPTGAVAVLLAGGRLIGAPGTAGFGGRAVDASGVFMDFDGQPQARPDITTRGIMTFDRSGCPARRIYLDVFPDVSLPSLGAARGGAAVRPARACGRTALQPLAAAGAGLPVSRAAARLAGAAGPFAVRRTRPACPGRLTGPRLVVRQRGRRLSGSVSAGRCGRRVAPVARVVLTAGGAPPQLLTVRSGPFVTSLPGGPVTVAAVDTDGERTTRRVGR